VILIKAREITAMNQKIPFLNVDSSPTGTDVSESNIMAVTVKKLYDHIVSMHSVDKAFTYRKKEK
jgi:hypothetical protein